MLLDVERVAATRPGFAAGVDPRGAQVYDAAALAELRAALDAVARPEGELLQPAAWLASSASLSSTGCWCSTHRHRRWSEDKCTQLAHGTDIAAHFDMTHEVVVITGATAGVGRALARRFARGGAKIALLARGPHKLAETLTEVIDLGGEALALEVDVADPDAVEDAAKQIEQDLGPIDIWINNAAVGMFGRINDMTPKEIERVTDVNYHGAVWGTKAALARMKTRGRGTIVQVGSGAGYRALPLLTAYSATKFALRGFTEGLRVELLNDGIDVNLTMVHLSAINTPFYTWARNLMPRQARPLPPIYQPEIAADIIHWAAHSRRRDVFVGWSTIAVVIADKLAPALLDRLLAWFAFDFQQTSEPTPLDQGDNLFEPVEVDLGIHGKFDALARSRAPLVKLIARLGGVGLRMLVVGTAIVIVGRALRR